MSRQYLSQWKSSNSTISRQDFAFVNIFLDDSSALHRLSEIEMFLFFQIDGNSNIDFSVNLIGNSGKLGQLPLDIVNENGQITTIQYQPTS